MCRQIPLARWLLCAVSLLAAAACGGDNPTGPSENQPLEIVFEGVRYGIAGVFAIAETSFDQPGLRVYFVRTSGKTCGDLSLFLEGATAFYPASGSGHSGPTSVTMRIGHSSFGEGSSPAYPGAITSLSSATVSGWIRALELGYNDDSAIDVTFTATRCAG